MIDAIVYCSKSGHTLNYAKVLAEELKLPLLSLQKARKKLKRDSNIIFISWVKEDKIVNYDKALKFHIDSVIAVGIMLKEEDMLTRLKSENVLYSKLFYLRGGINKKKLSIRNRINLKTLENSLSFKLLDSGLTKSHASALEAIMKNLDYTNYDDLDEIVNYYNKMETNLVS